MKVKEYTAWASNKLIKNIIDNNTTDQYVAEGLNLHQNFMCDNKITIIIEVPEKTGTITESQFQEVVGLAGAVANPKNSGFEKIISNLKQEIFGKD